MYRGKRFLPLIIWSLVASSMVACGPKNNNTVDSDSILSQNPAENQSRNLPEKVTIAFTGDIMMGTTFPIQFMEPVFRPTTESISLMMSGILSPQLTLREEIWKEAFLKVPAIDVV